MLLRACGGKTYRSPSSDRLGLKAGALLVRPLANNEHAHQPDSPVPYATKSAAWAGICARTCSNRASIFGWQFSRFPHSPSPSPAGRVAAAAAFQPPANSGHMYTGSILANRTPVARQKNGPAEARKLEDRSSEMGTRSRMRPVLLPAERPFAPHHGRPPPAVEAGRSTARGRKGDSHEWHFRLRRKDLG